MKDQAGQEGAGIGDAFGRSCEVIDALPLTPFHRGRVIAAATIATQSLERRRRRKTEDGREASVMESLHDIEMLSRIAMLLMMAERTKSASIMLTREDFKIIERPWTMLTGASARSPERP